MTANQASSTPRRRRGAPPGNHNALKHGFYSHSFTSSEKKRLSTDMMGEFRDEIMLIEILIDRAWDQAQNTDIAGQDWLEVLRTITHAIGRKESLARTRRLIYQQAFTPQDVINELAEIPFDQD